jgi:hypothetical protein
MLRDRATFLRGGGLPFVAGAAYVAVLALVADRGREPGGWVWELASMAFAVAATWWATGIARWVGWGGAVVVASLGAQNPSRALDACGGLGVLAAVAGACIAMARLPCEGGVVRAEPRSGRAEGGVLAVIWWSAVVATAAPDDHRLRVAVLEPAGWRWGAMILSAAALIASCAVPLRRRRLEIAVVERARAARSLVIACGIVGLVVAVLGPGRPEAVARVMLAVAASGVAAVALHPDAVRASRVARRLVTLVTFGGTVGLLGATAVEGHAGDAWSATLLTACATLGIGALVVRLEGFMRPGSGAWLDAFAVASDDAMLNPDPLDAIRAVLLALQSPLGAGGPPAELWTLAPPRALFVDAAGYAHERDAALPPELLAIASAEPEGTLRSEVLDALEVRRPELRGAAAWMSDRRALVAVVIAGGGETEGLLVLPRGSRTDSLTLEEVRALKRVADRLAAVCRVGATEARMLARVQEATARGDAFEQSVERLRHERTLDAGRHALAAARLSRPATLGTYAAASRMALEAIERRAAISAPIAIVAPSGVDPIPYLARVHLGGARAADPLVLVDATNATEHDVTRWVDPSVSPLALADRGLLVLLDGAALPLEVQRLIARACTEARAPWERADRLDVQLALTGVETPQALVDAGRLDPSLAARLGDALDAPVLLPGLKDRPEDFRAILTDRLAREGLRAVGHPVGIEAAAYARLAEYPFAGEDAELSAIVVRLVGRCAGDTVKRADVDAVLDPRSAPAQETANDATAPARASHVPVDGRDSKRRKDPISA